MIWLEKIKGAAFGTGLLHPCIVPAPSSKNHFFMECRIRSFASLRQTVSAEEIAAEKHTQLLFPNLHGKSELKQTTPTVLFSFGTWWIENSDQFNATESLVQNAYCSGRIDYASKPQARVVASHLEFY